MLCGLAAPPSPAMLLLFLLFLRQVALSAMQLYYCTVPPASGSLLRTCQAGSELGAMLSLLGTWQPVTAACFPYSASDAVIFADNSGQVWRMTACSVHCLQCDMACCLQLPEPQHGVWWQHTSGEVLSLPPSSSPPLAPVFWQTALPCCRVAAGILPACSSPTVSCGLQLAACVHAKTRGISGKNTHTYCLLACAVAHCASCFCCPRCVPQGSAPQRTTGLLRVPLPTRHCQTPGRSWSIYEPGGLRWVLAACCGCGTVWLRFKLKEHA